MISLSPSSSYKIALGEVSGYASSVSPVSDICMILSAIRLKSSIRLVLSVSPSMFVLGSGKLMDIIAP